MTEELAANRPREQTHRRLRRAAKTASWDDGRPRRDKEGKDRRAKSAVLCSSRRRQTVDKLPKVAQSGRRENRLPLSADSTKSGIESHETVRSSWVEKKVTEEGDSKSEPFNRGEERRKEA